MHAENIGCIFFCLTDKRRPNAPFDVLSASRRTSYASCRGGFNSRWRKLDKRSHWW